MEVIKVLVATGADVNMVNLFMLIQQKIRTKIKLKNCMKIKN